MISSSFIPDQKVLAGGIGGAAAWLIIMALEHFAGISISSDVAGLIVAAIVPLVGWVVPPSVADVAKRLDTDIRQVFEERQSASPGLSEPREMPTV